MKKTKIICIIAILTLVLASCTNKENNYQSNDQEPKEIVESYFNAWNNKDYKTMYNSISDGFKSIEPTAKTLDDFKSYAQSQGIEGVTIMSITQASNNGKKAMVSYGVEFTINNQQVLFAGSYTLKYKPDEVALEAPFMGKNPQSMLKLGRAQGVSMAAALSRDIPVTEYAPKKIKQSITGQGTASKEQVAAMLKNIFKLRLIWICTLST